MSFVESQISIFAFCLSSEIIAMILPIYWVLLVFLTRVILVFVEFFLIYNHFLFFEKEFLKLFEFYDYSSFNY